jgi:antitoxin (DNA-binding transcriptional repressor) of toxin-antitoxin stability system
MKRVMYYSSNDFQQRSDEFGRNHTSEVYLVAPSRNQSPVSLVEGDKPLVYPMRELNQQTARVLNEIKKYDRPGFITKHGRFDFMIVPLQPGQIESKVLPEIAREIGKQLQN